MLTRWTTAALAGFLLIAACGDDDGGMPDVVTPDSGSMCIVDSDCDNRIFCDGAERCEPLAEGADANGCAPPLRADPCASDQRCDEGARGCLPLCEVNPDFDGDGEDAAACGGTDCDDDDARRGSGNPELCDAEGLDEDCDTNTLGPDLDNDSFVSMACCNEQASGTLRCGLDCNDDDMEVNPREFESCNGVDDDCDGSTDEGLEEEFFPDCDDDGQAAAGSDPVIGCAAPSESPEGCPGGDWVRAFEANDCDDFNPRVSPAATETCDGLDNDCNGLLDGPDADRDDDGLAVCEETCAGDPNLSMPANGCLCGEPTDDGDGDGVARCADACPRDPLKVSPGACGCGRVDSLEDSNGDGVLDCNELFSDDQEYFRTGDAVFPQSNGATSVVSADLDGSGRPDIVVANEGQDDVTVHFNGAFESPVHYAMGIGPVSVRTADFNGDGVLDLVTANRGADGLMVPLVPAVPADVTVRLGVGDGTFGAVVSYPLMVDGRAEVAVATADLDGDGAVDLVVAIGDSDSVSVRLGVGDGTFAAPEMHPAGDFPSSVIAADLDGDDVPDLIVANRDSGDVSVSLGVGDGSFLDPVFFSMGTRVLSVVAVNLNGDRALDLVTANALSRDVSVRLGNGDGTFGPAAGYRIGGGLAFPRRVMAVDFNGDGAQDVLVANRVEHSVTLMLGRGDGTFGSTSEILIGVPASVGREPQTFPSSIVVDYFDDDGVLDLVTANSGGNDQVPNDVTLVHGRGAGLFAPPVTYTMGTAPESILAADLNGDGALDLLSENHGEMNIVARLGRGDGTFSASTVSSALGEQASALAAVDLNEDGVLDVVSANNLSANVGVQLGFGDGSFAGPLFYAMGNVGGGPESLATGDLDGDGAVDLVTANQGSNGIFVRLGNGDGSLAEDSSRYAMGLRPGSVAITDLDGDDILDVVTMNSTSNDATLRLGNGDGTFGEPVAYAMGAASGNGLVVDLDGDGAMDLVSANSSLGITVRLGNGDGTFAGLVPYALGSAVIVEITAADIDGDGVPDLFATYSRSREMLVRFGNGDGTFGRFLRLPFEDPITGVGIFIADLDGNGAVDLVDYHSTYGARVRLALRAPADVITTPSLISPRSLAHGDVNADGEEDLIVAAVGARAVALHLADGVGGFHPPVRLRVGEQPTDAALLDVDNDGDLDVVATNELSGDVSVILGAGDGSFGTHTRFPTGLMPQSVAGGDVDGDGDVDLVVASELDGTVSLLIGAGDGTFTLATALPVGDAPFDVRLEDLSGDGALDILSVDSGSDQLSILLGGDDGTFGVAMTFAVGSVPKAVAISDLNGDGNVDLVVANQGDPDDSPADLLHDLSFLRGIGDGTFEAAEPISLGIRALEPQSVLIADENGDGHSDLVVANEQSNNVSICRGRGDGTFEAPFRIPLGTAPQAVVAVDVNGDGRVELVTANEGSDDLSIIRRR